MKIGIVVYSQTGNTLSVAQKLSDRLKAKGHQAAVERIAVAGDPGDAQNIRFGALPDLTGYDALVFAAPVQGFSLCPAMKAYLPKMPALQGRKAAYFVTKQLPGDWTGGSKALSMIGAAIAEKGGVACGSGILHWNKRDAEADALAERLAGLF